MLSLERTFASTMFAVYHFSGLFLGALALVTILAVRGRRRGELAGGPAWEETLHDLGKLVFAFAFFWGYIWYCQFMLIWYTNLPEETSWYVPRLQGMWRSTGALSFVLNGALPFVLLLFRRVRRSEKALLRVAVLVLVGRVAELFFHVGPPTMKALGPSPWPSPWEVLPVVGLVSLFALVVLQALARGPSVRADEPGLDYSLHYHA